MASETEIANLALSHLGIGKEIASLETEKSEEATACRRFYTLLRDSSLRDFPWPFATKIIAVGLVEEDPNDEWSFSYRYPTDCLKLRRILSGTRNDNRQTRIPYKVARDDDGLLIWTDKEDAEVEYTVKETNPERFSADFVTFLSLRLSVAIAPRLTRGDPFKMGERAARLYELEVSKARATAVNEQQDEENPESEFISGRE